MDKGPKDPSYLKYTKVASALTSYREHAKAEDKQLESYWLEKAQSSIESQLITPITEVLDALHLPYDPDGPYIDLNQDHPEVDIYIEATGVSGHIITVEILVSTSPSGDYSLKFNVSHLREVAGRNRRLNLDMSGGIFRPDGFVKKKLKSKVSGTPPNIEVAFDEKGLFPDIEATFDEKSTFPDIEVAFDEKSTKDIVAEIARYINKYDRDSRKSSRS